MQVILSDHNCVGHAEAIFNAIKRLGFLDIAPMVLLRFEQVGLAIDADDEVVWQMCQENGWILLTGNRTRKDGEQSLEAVIRRLLQPDSLPVITIGDLNRVLIDRRYCARCATRLTEIVFDLQERYLGVMRLYLT